MNGRYMTPATLSKIFQQEARKIAGDFPALEGKFLLIDKAANENTAFMSAEKLDLESDQQVNELTEKLLERYTQEKTGLADLRYGVNVIVLGKDIGDDHYNLPPEQQALLIFDHELGHLVVRDALKGNHDNFKENCADAYAHLRAYQRWGQEQGDAILNATRFYRQFRLARHGSWTHYTIPTLQAVADIARHRNLSGLTGPQTADLAYQLACKHAPSGYVLKTLHEAFGDIAAPPSEMSEFARLADESAKRLANNPTAKDKFNYSNLDEFALRLAHAVEKGECHDLAFRIAGEILKGLLSGDHMADKEKPNLDSETKAAALRAIKLQTNQGKKIHGAQATPVSGLYRQGR